MSDRDGFMENNLFETIDEFWQLIAGKKIVD
jgi:hypothetical protein